jgi:hypothetical protein
MTSSPRRLEPTSRRPRLSSFSSICSTAASICAVPTGVKNHQQRQAHKQGTNRLE